MGADIAAAVPWATVTGAALSLWLAFAFAERVVPDARYFRFRVTGTD